MSQKEDYKTRKLKSPDGTIRIIFDGKLHSWDGKNKASE